MHSLLNKTSELNSNNIEFLCNKERNTERLISFDYKGRLLLLQNSRLRSKQFLESDTKNVAKYLEATLTFVKKYSYLYAKLYALFPMRSSYFPLKFPILSSINLLKKLSEPFLFELIGVYETIKPSNGIILLISFLNT